jgi:hypothetical protein
MESNNYEWFMSQTVEAMLPRFTDREIVLTMKIDANWDDYGYGPDGNTQVREQSNFRNTFFLAFSRPSNYTKVLMVEIPQPPFDKKFGHLQHLPCSGKIQMKQLSDHDSCWRSDGFNWVFQSFVNAWAFFDDKGIEGRHVNPGFHYSIFGGEPQYWLIKDLQIVDESQRWDSDYIIDFQRKIKMHEISKFMTNTINS